MANRITHTRTERRREKENESVRFTLYLVYKLLLLLVTNNNKQWKREINRKRAERGTENELKTKRIEMETGDTMGDGDRSIEIERFRFSFLFLSIIYCLLW